MLNILKKYIIVFVIGAILVLVGLFVYGRDMPIVRNVVARIYLKQFMRENKYQNPPGLPEVVLPSFPDRDCNVASYGGIGDGKVSNTQAIAAAIEDCYSSGGGRVVIPKGTWLTGPIHLKSGINLFLSEDAEVTFSDKREDYLPVVLSRYQGMDLYNYSPLIYARDSENIAITGKGKLIGNGESWQDWGDDADSSYGRERLFDMSEDGLPVEERVFGTFDSGLRPSFVVFVNSKNILLEDFYIENGPHWTIHPIYSENITIQRIDVKTWGANTDGVAIDSSRNVVIRDSQFSTGDDVIVIKSGLEADGMRVNKPSENILIDNCEATKGHSGVAIGSELSGGIRNVVIRNSKFISTEEGLRIKTTATRGGYVDGVWLDNIDMEGIESVAILVDAEYESALTGDDASKTSIKNVFISNIVINNGDSYAVDIQALATDQVSNFHLKKIKSSSRRGFSLHNAGGIYATELSLKTRKLPLFEIENSRGIYINSVGCDKNIKECVVFEGSFSDRIFIDSSTNITNKRVKVPKGQRNPAVFL